MSLCSSLTCLCCRETFSPSDPTQDQYLPALMDGSPQLSRSVFSLQRKVRGMVSSDRRRYFYESPDGTKSFDLDLTYITKHIIGESDVRSVQLTIAAMSWPGSGLETAWRNSLEEVGSFLQHLHGQDWMVWNLTEREYQYEKLNNQILSFPFPDHHAPPLEFLFEIIHSLERWLVANENNVAVIHCKGGKGRTASCCMFYLGLFESGEAAIARFADRRSHTQRGVEQPSQTRYVSYFTKILTDKHNVYQPQCLEIASILLYVLQVLKYRASLPDLGSVILYSSNVSRDTTEGRTLTVSLVVDGGSGVMIEGDVLVRLLELGSNREMCHLIFNTMFIKRSRVLFPRKAVDGAFRDRRFSDTFYMDFTFVLPKIDRDPGSNIWDNMKTRYQTEIQPKVIDAIARGIEVGTAAELDDLSNRISANLNQKYESTAVDDDDTRSEISMDDVELEMEDEADFDEDELTLGTEPKSEETSKSDYNGSTLPMTKVPSGTFRMNRILSPLTSKKEVKKEEKPLPPQYHAAIIREGTLELHREKGIKGQTMWKSLYYQLVPGYLAEFYEKGGGLRRVVPLSDAIQLCDYRPQKYPFAFRLTLNVITVVLRAIDEFDLQMWLNEFHKQKIFIAAGEITANNSFFPPDKILSDTPQNSPRTREPSSPPLSPPSPTLKSENSEEKKKKVVKTSSSFARRFTIAANPFKKSTNSPSLPQHKPDAPPIPSRDLTIQNEVHVVQAEIQYAEEHPDQPSPVRDLIESTQQGTDDSDRTSPPNRSVPPLPSASMGRSRQNSVISSDDEISENTHERGRSVSMVAGDPSAILLNRMSENSGNRSSYYNSNDIITRPRKGSQTRESTIRTASVIYAPSIVRYWYQIPQYTWDMDDSDEEEEKLMGQVPKRETPVVPSPAPAFVFDKNNKRISSMGPYSRMSTAREKDTREIVL
ncbi:phosphatase tensin type domain-containing protein [Planoprotostelium fungivorum]|uniref:Phosphatase tensin type domain-containing protein n=1 Tax=Planoprotostelium fungivorum TaxID=1890364 RepID=A0A2P6N0Z9_9EUKA|nr:phosphatase tensin type domain-containing protein [Planoprotostelium fungivorum]